MTDFLSIAIIGAVVSLFQEWLKSKMNLTPLLNKTMAVSFALVLGTAYYFASSTVWWTSVLGVLASATTVYGLVIRNGQ